MKRALAVGGLALVCFLAGCSGDSSLKQAIDACRGHGGIAYANFGEHESLDELRCSE